jgi:hypothetical protein
VKGLALQLHETPSGKKPRKGQGIALAETVHGERIAHPIPAVNILDAISRRGHPTQPATAAARSRHLALRVEKPLPFQLWFQFRIQFQVQVAAPARARARARIQRENWRSHEDERWSGAKEGRNLGNQDRTSPHSRQAS